MLDRLHADLSMMDGELKQEHVDYIAGQLTGYFWVSEHISWDLWSSLSHESRNLAVESAKAVHNQKLSLTINTILECALKLMEQGKEEPRQGSIGQDVGSLLSAACDSVESKLKK